uniref:Uncharacterized protein n=1 Tax=Anguilla anguilla TaxID=7936 RepID=A0A0E9TY78_ANGAN
MLSCDDHCHKTRARLSSQLYGHTSIACVLCDFFCC